MASSDLVPTTPDKDASSQEFPAPQGWQKKISTTKRGSTPSKRDVYFLAPDGEKITSKKALEKYLKSHPGGPPVSEFDWSTGETPTRRSSRLSSKTRPSFGTPESAGKRAKKTAEESQKKAEEKKETETEDKEEEHETKQAESESKPDEEMEDAGKDEEKKDEKEAGTAEKDKCQTEVQPEKTEETTENVVETEAVKMDEDVKQTEENADDKKITAAAKAPAIEAQDEAPAGETKEDEKLVTERKVDEEKEKVTDEDKVEEKVTDEGKVEKKAADEKPDSDKCSEPSVKEDGKEQNEQISNAFQHCPEAPPSRHVDVSS